MNDSILSKTAFDELPLLTWSQVTEPQAYLNNQTRIIPQGKGLGGGTLINAMLWNRGDTQDYDTWAALGNEGWDFASMLPYFERVSHTICKILSVARSCLPPLLVNTNFTLAVKLYEFKYFLTVRILSDR